MLVELADIQKYRKKFDLHFKYTHVLDLLYTLNTNNLTCSEWCLSSLWSPSQKSSLKSLIFLAVWFGPLPQCTCMKLILAYFIICHWKNKSPNIVGRLMPQISSTSCLSNFNAVDTNSTYNHKAYYSSDLLRR